MAKRKKSKLKIKNIILMLLLVLFIVLIFKALFKENLKIELTNDLNVGEELKFNASFKGKDVTNSVTFDGDLDANKLGKYTIKFTYNDGKKSYTVTKKIQVKDLTKPEITLNKGEKITIVLGSDYKEAGYEASDNIDGDLTKQVKVTGDVDTSREGSYELVYKVADKSGNEQTIIRTIIVTSESPLNMSVKEFSLNGYYDDVVLKETDDKGEKYSDEFIFAGDSTALYYVINKLIPGKRLWHREGIDPETALTNSIYINHIDTSMTFVQNISKYKPSKMLMTLGTNSASYMEPEYFIKNYKKLISEMIASSPDTLIIIQSIPPVDSSYDSKGTGINNDKINKLNYYILEMCNELNIPFLNSAEALKDSDGALKAEYSIKDGIHLSKEGNTVIMKYFQNHAHEG